MQIIDMRQDPGAVATQNALTEAAQGALRKKELDLLGFELGIKAKQASNEVDKLKFDQMKMVNDAFKKALDMGLFTGDPEGDSRAMAAIAGDNPNAMYEYLAYGGGKRQTMENQKRAADIKKINDESNPALQRTLAKEGITGMLEGVREFNAPSGQGGQGNSLPAGMNVNARFGNSNVSFPISARPLPDSVMKKVSDDQRLSSDIYTAVAPFITDGRLQKYLGLAKTPQRGLLRVSNSPEAGTARMALTGVEKQSQTYRKIITGAQAGLQEIEYLKNLVLNVNDEPEAFFSKLYQLALGARYAMQQDKSLMEASGYDTRMYDTAIKQLNQQIATYAPSISEKTRQALDARFNTATASSNMGAGSSANSVGRFSIKVKQ